MPSGSTQGVNEYSVSLQFNSKPFGFSFSDGLLIISVFRAENIGLHFLFVGYFNAESRYSLCRNCL